jgi:hypothetical protein
MSFLDNSGDIILDAVLTETGRRRMAEGNFKITKFALGDDEIDYSLYNKNHASGSAYYDLEILQTPVFEAFTQVNAGINYGLLPVTAVDLLFLPTMKFNEKALSVNGVSNISKNSGVFYVSDTSNNTGNASGTDIGLTLKAGSIDFMSGQSDGSYILIETGLDTGAASVPNGTADNRQSYLVANNLVDRSFRIYYDSRYIDIVNGPAPSSATSGNKFNNTGNNNDLQASFGLERARPVSDNTIGLENYVAANVAGVQNLIVNNTSGNDTAETFSVINGPRASVIALSVHAKPGLSAEYTLYGGTTTVDSKSVQYIDTTVYVQGLVSSAQIQIPIRIARLA